MVSSICICHCVIYVQVNVLVKTRVRMLAHIAESFVYFSLLHRQVTFHVIFHAADNQVVHGTFQLTWQI